MFVFYETREKSVSMAPVSHWRRGAWASRGVARAPIISPSFLLLL